METAAKTTKKCMPKANERLSEEISFKEFQRELEKIKNRAPGIDRVAVNAIKKMKDKTKKIFVC